MKVLDATFLIDYLNGVESSREYLQEHDSETYVLPVPAYAEALLGEGNGPGGDIDGAREDLSWGEVYTVDERTAVTAAEITDEMEAQGPFLSGMDALIAAVGRELDAPAVSRDGDLTREATKQVVDIEEY
ncbi:VapC toxin family PIN domain ribonuclease [Halobacteriales archaeon QS_9_68_42]|nr:MAG: VapC toxin family PIN domain ribonuclease [Halobacteriales archaeon QS_9_68_42]